MNVNSRANKTLMIGVLIGALLQVGAGQVSGAIDSAYQQSFDEWKTGLSEGLKQEWLPLAGLFWLKEGDNSFGSDRKNAIVFPKGPERAGSFTLRDKDVTLQLAPGITATIDDQPGAQAKLQPDISGHPTEVAIGSLHFHVIVRGQRIGIRLSDQESDAVRRWPGPQFFPLNMNYRVAARWVPAQAKRTVAVPDVLGDVHEQPVAGTVVFKINGEEVQLTDLGGQPAKGLFFVFNDLTSKTDTYPGGRFLRTGGVVDGKVEIDFNRAYNPPCAVTPYATCPLAPKENRLKVAIPVGEKYDHGQH